MEINSNHHTFAKAIARGLSNKEAAIEAGYEAKSASQQGSRLAREAQIKELVEKYRRQLPPDTLPVATPKEAVLVEVDDVPTINRFQHDCENDKPFNEFDEISSSLDSIKTDDPLEFLIQAMGCSGLDDSKRIDAAKAALPYKHGKVGDKGKKETKEEAAVAASSKGGLSGRLAELRKVK